MSQAPQPSFVRLPATPPPYPALLDFLAARFPKIDRAIWQRRLEQGKITDDAGQIVTAATPYAPQRLLRYYREVATEPEIPFVEEILFQNDHILVACKPHFLPVTPSGPYVTQCLLYRLKQRTGCDDIVPVHRIDRETAGLVLFSLNHATRRQYHDLFRLGQAHKIYEAATLRPADPTPRTWEIRSRIVTGEPWFLMQEVAGAVNAITQAELLGCAADFAYFRLAPLTGKQHQLRLHLAQRGAPILYDRFYPVLYPKDAAEDFARPLQLLAKALRFRDPISGQALEFCSSRRLLHTL